MFKWISFSHKMVICLPGFLQSGRLKENRFCLSGRRALLPRITPLTWIDQVITHNFRPTIKHCSSSPEQISSGTLLGLSMLKGAMIQSVTPFGFRKRQGFLLK